MCLTSVLLILYFGIIAKTERLKNMRNVVCYKLFQSSTEGLEVIYLIIIFIKSKLPSIIY